MTTPQIDGAEAPGLVTPTRENAGRQPGVTEVQRKAVSDDFRSSGASTQAALTIEGDAYALAYLDRLQSGTVSPDDLVVLMAFLRDAMLAGACRAITNAQVVPAMREHLLERAQSLASALIAPGHRPQDLAALSLADLWGVYRFLRRLANA
jgi:hypothetical protein